jgi:hypothetical protein
MAENESASKGGFNLDSLKNQAMGGILKEAGAYLEKSKGDIAAKVEEAVSGAVSGAINDIVSKGVKNLTDKTQALAEGVKPADAAQTAKTQNTAE